MPVILAGMHRSGTSFAASLLQAAGVAMGERLYPADRGNVKGHFEDMDFLEVHRAALAHLGLDETGWTDAWPLQIAPEVAANARQLAAAKAAAFAQNHSHGAAGWGWKDPRTTLFLEFWRTLFPAARFVFMYREPWEVADSLYRRATDKPILEKPRRAIDLWAAYNRRVIEFVHAHPHQSLVVSNDAATAAAAAFIRAINEKFGMALAQPAQNLFDPEVMVKEQAGSWREAVVADLSPDAMSLYAQLQQLAALRGRDAAAASQDRAAAAEKLVNEWAQQRAGRVKSRELQAAYDGLVAKYGRVYGEVMGHRRQAARLAALLGVMAEVSARPRGVGAAVKGMLKSPVWETAALRKIPDAPDEEDAVPQSGMVLRYVFAGPMEPGKYVARITANATPEVRLALAHAGGAEVAGASAKIGPDGLAVCELTVAEPVEVGMITLDVGGEVSAFHMERG
jgi:hypothetical protein